MNKDALLGVLVAALVALGVFSVWRDREVRHQYNVVVHAKDSTIKATGEELQAAKKKSDSLLIVAASSRTVYVTKWETRWDTLKVEIDRPTLTLPEALTLLHVADSTIGACSLALKDCTKGTVALLNQTRVDSLLIIQLNDRLKLEQSRPRGSSWATKLGYAAGGATAASTVCALVH